MFKILLPGERLKSFFLLKALIGVPSFDRVLCDNSSLKLLLWKFSRLINAEDGILDVDANINLSYLFISIYKIDVFLMELCYFSKLSHS